MQHRMRVGLAWMIAAGVACLGVACANGATPVLLDEGTPAVDSGPSSYLPPTTPREAGTPKNPDEPADAAATDASVKDSAAPVDGSVPPPTGNGDCVGPTSTQLKTSYDEACDNYWFNTFGKSNDCTPGANTCAALNNATYTFCCFKPPPLSDCAFDYFNTPQCIPK